MSKTFMEDINIPVLCATLNIVMSPVYGDI